MSNEIEQDIKIDCYLSTSMAKVNLTIDDEIEKCFRQVAYRENQKQGYLKKAVEEALSLYIKIKTKGRGQNE